MNSEHPALRNGNITVNDSNIPLTPRIGMINLQIQNAVPLPNPPLSVAAEQVEQIERELAEAAEGILDKYGFEAEQIDTSLGDHFTAVDTDECPVCNKPTTTTGLQESRFGVTRKLECSGDNCNWRGDAYLRCIDICWEEEGESPPLPISTEVTIDELEGFHGPSAVKLGLLDAEYLKL